MPRDIQLLKNVPPRPQPAGSLSLTGNVWDDMVGLLNKWNAQFRRPFPQDCIAEPLETWRKVATDDLDGRQMQMFSDQEYRIARDDFWGTSIWDLKDVNWSAIKNGCSSMLVPTKATSSAVGDVSFYYVREKVLGICFPALCWLLREDYTAEEIEAAWEHMPVLKIGKANRSGPGPGQKRKAHSDVGSWQRWY